MPPRFLIILILLLLFGFIPGEERVEEIIFQGNKNYTSRFLKRLITTKTKQVLDEANLDFDLQVLRNFYYNEGFQSVQVEKKIVTTQKGKIVYFIIQEGTRVRINIISLSGFLAFPEKKIQNLLNLKVGDYLIMRNLENGEKQLIDLYKNSGYPYVEIEREIKVKDSLATVYFSIYEGPLSYIKEVQIRGNNKVNAWTIRRASEIKLGEKFSQAHLYQAQSRLYATRLFERVAFYVIGMEAKSESLTIRFDVSELPARGLNFGIGYQLPPSRFLFGLGWEHLNILNRGQNLAFNSEFTPNFKGDYELNLEAVYKVPYLIRLPLNFATRPFLNLTDLEGNKTTEFGLETGINRYLGSNLGIALSNRFRSLKFSHPDTTTPDTTSRGITNSLIFNITYDSRNNFFNPNQGIYLSPILEVAGGLLLGNNDFYRARCELRIYKKAFGELVLGVRGLVGSVLPYGRTLTIPYYEKFFVGGRNTLRGYDEKALGPDSIGKEHYGDFIINTNFEIRTNYYKNFGLVLFWDGAEIENGITDFSFNRYQYSIGFGLRFNTPVGPVRLDYGKRLKNPKPADRGKLYIGLLHAF
uniref:Outer membrane protein assembly factor BamA n=1 Tax=candidate division WOR-3 bacterium TaxID=2052148 RepID=A0A7C6EDI4_UNCW3